MSLKAVVRLGSVPPSPLFTVKADRCILRLNADTEEQLRFDRVYTAEVPARDIFSDGLLPLVKLAMSGRCSSVILLGHGHSHGTSFADRDNTRKTQKVTREHSSTQESELGLGLALVWLTLQSLLIGPTCDAATSSLDGLAVLISWCRFSSTGGEPADVLRELLRAGKAASSKCVVPSTGSSVAETPPPPHLHEDANISLRDATSQGNSAVNRGASRVNVAGLTEVVLNSTEGLLETLKTAQACIGHQDHSLLNVAVERGVLEPRGSLCFFTLASGSSGTEALQSAASQSGRFATDVVTSSPSGQPVAPEVDRLLKSCFQPPHRTLVVATVKSCSEDVLPMLRLAASLHASNISNSARPSGVQSVDAGGNANTRACSGSCKMHDAKGGDSRTSGATGAEAGTAMSCSMGKPGTVTVDSSSSCSSSRGGTAVANRARRAGCHRTRLSMSAPHRCPGLATPPELSRFAANAAGAQRVPSAGRRPTAATCMVPRGHRRGYGRGSLHSGHQCSLGNGPVSRRSKDNGFTRTSAATASTVLTTPPAHAKPSASAIQSKDRQVELKQLVEAQGQALVEMQAKAAALELRCTVLTEEMRTRGCELSEDVKQALKAKDRAILELQVRAAEARRRETQLLADLETAGRQLALFHRAAKQAQECAAHEGASQQLQAHEAAQAMDARGLVGCQAVTRQELDISEVPEHDLGVRVSAAEACEIEVQHQALQAAAKKSLVEDCRVERRNQEYAVGSQHVSESLALSEERVSHSISTAEPADGATCEQADQWKWCWLEAAQDVEGDAFRREDIGLDASESEWRQSTASPDLLLTTAGSSNTFRSMGSPYPNPTCALHVSDTVPSKLSVSLQSTASSLATLSSPLSSHEAIARPWELAELRGFLEATFGDLGKAIRGLGNGESVVNVDEFISGLGNISFSSDRDFLLRLWATLDTDKDGLISVSDLLDLPE